MEALEWSDFPRIMHFANTADGILRAYDGNFNNVGCIDTYKKVDQFVEGEISLDFFSKIDSKYE